MKTNWILHDDQRIYHLKLKSDEVAPIILTVGDPDRIELISQILDRIETNVQSREFKTITGYLNGKRITVISTGIGTDNIDIVINELDALFNWDFEKDEARSRLQQLQFIRLGTSGAIQEDIEVDQLMVTEHSFSIGGVLPYYNSSGQFQHPEIKPGAFGLGLEVFYCQADPYLLEHFKLPGLLPANTLTCTGFYAPQGRYIRGLKNDLLETWHSWKHPEFGSLHNLEMETAGIYGLSKLLGHRAISIQAILANRITGAFSAHPEKTIVHMIERCLDRISGL